MIDDRKTAPAGRSDARSGEAAKPRRGGKPSPAETSKVLSRLKRAASSEPDDLEAQIAYATALGQTRDGERTLEAWTAIHLRFPSAGRAARQRIAWLVRLHRTDEARALIDAAHPPEIVDVESLLERSDLLLSAADSASALAVLDRAVRLHPSSTAARVRYAQRLRQAGRIVEALEAVRPTLEAASKSARALHDELDRAVQTLRRLAPVRMAAGHGTGLIALECLLERYKLRSVRAPQPRRLGPTAMITGSLGPGGAERQLAMTAEILGKARAAGRRIGATSIAGPLHVVLKSLSGEGERDFFLPMLSGADVVLDEIDRMAPVTPVQAADGDDDLHALLPLLHPSIIYGLRLAAWFRREQVDTAFLWQDGATLFAAPAALLAGVPHIVLNFRGLPPVIRRHKFLPEYHVLYRGLLDIPGVTFASNSAVAAAAYSEWIGCPVSRFQIIRNGVDPPEWTPQDSDLKKAAAFDRRTSGCTRTIGAVFRLEIDKRPTQWILFAHHYLSRHPRARFILVGKGPMLEQMRQLARDLKIANRLLFVGYSRAVGFWLRKMDAFVLLSRFEGTPNALIEAQMAGVGVVSTPVGNATATFIPGVTGFATREVDPVDYDEVAAHVDQIVEWARTGDFLSRMAAQNATARFSKEAMVKHTVDVLTGTAIGMPKPPTKQRVKRASTRVPPQT